MRAMRFGGGFATAVEEVVMEGGGANCNVRSGKINRDVRE